LRKQLSSYENDNSEETKAKVQKLKLELSQAEEELAETEYEKMVSDSEKLLDNLYSEYEEILNSRLDNIDGLISDAITAINENAGTIAQALSSAAGGVGYTMSESMSGIWEEAKALDDADRATRVSQTKATIDALTTEGALLPSKAQDIITTLGAGSEAEATATLDLVNKMVANGEITKQEANRIIAALSTGDQQKVLETLNLTDQLIADGKMTQTDADAVVNALITGDAQATKNAENIIKQLVSNGNLSTKDSKTITDALNSAKDESVNVVTEYGENFGEQDTEVNDAIDGIENGIKDAIDASDEEGKKNIDDGGTKPSSKDPPKTNPPKTDPPKTQTPKASELINKGAELGKQPTKTSGDGKAKVGDKVKFVSGKYYASSDGLKPTGTKNQGKQVYITKINTASWATHPYHISTGKKLGSGDLGWLKLKQLSGYASGKKNFANDEVAWTQENGQEFIIRPSDGAILTPIAKSDSVLNAAASSNIWDMANNPADFIKNNLNLGAANAPNNSNVQNSYTQHLENITFSFPNVHSYDEMLKQMQKDKSFEKLITAMTIDRIAGRSALAKGKAIR
jgi:polyhydroxyalkanoate synthesis regulator phasin